jgi:hypothetical protein
MDKWDREAKAIERIITTSMVGKGTIMTRMAATLIIQVILICKDRDKLKPKATD